MRKPLPLQRPLLLALAICLLFLVPGRSYARETAAEHAASAYAAAEINSTPLHGNIPDYMLSPAELAKSHELATERVTMHFAGELWSLLQLLALLFFGGIAWMRDRALQLSRNRWVQGFTFLLLFELTGFLLDLPLTLYRRSVSLHYGFSVQGWGSWAGDEAKSFGLEWLIGGLILMLLFWVIRKAPSRWWLVFWAFTVPLSLFSVFAQPYIEPLFFHYEPLAKSQPALVERLEQVARRGGMDIPPERMFLMQASAKLTTPNADVEGFGSSKRLVVWDTLLTKVSPEGVLLVFGHESGHYVLRHILRGLLLSFVGSFALLYLGFRFVRWALARYGARWRVPSQEDWGAVAVLLLAFGLFSAVFEPVGATLSRLQEHAADVYGQEAVHGIIPDPQGTAREVFDALGRTTFDDPHPSAFIEFWTYNHPATGRRAAFGKAYNPWLPGFAPRYFPPGAPAASR